MHWGMLIVTIYLSLKILNCKYASKNYSKDVEVTDLGDVTAVSANGGEAITAKQVSLHLVMHYLLLVALLIYN